MNLRMQLPIMKVSMFEGKKCLKPKKNLYGVDSIGRYVKNCHQDKQICMGWTQLVDVLKIAIKR